MCDICMSAGDLNSGHPVFKTSLLIYQTISLEPSILVVVKIIIVLYIQGLKHVVMGYKHISTLKKSYHRENNKHSHYLTELLFWCIFFLREY